MSALDMTLPAFAADRWRLQHGPADIDRYLLPTPALSSKLAGRRTCCRSMGQTDGRTDTTQTLLRILCGQRQQVSIITPLEAKRYVTSISAIYGGPVDDTATKRMLLK